jgi:CRISPR/Cas system CSM-associated protein Csm2 small subunit
MATSRHLYVTATCRHHQEQIMKTAEAIEAEINRLKDQLAKVQAREREARVSRLLSVLDASSLTDDEAVAAIEGAAKTKNSEAGK